MNRRKAYVFVFALFFILACGMQDLAQATPVPVDSLSIPTIVVLTADAAMTQTASAAPQPAPETPTALPTQTATVTQAPVFSTYGSALVDQPDGKVLFIDQKSGFQMTFPANWIVFRPNHDEYYALSVNEAIVDYPFLLGPLDFVKDQDPNETRVHAFSIAAGHLQDQYIPHMSAHWVEGMLPPEEGPVGWIETLKSKEAVFDVVGPPEQKENQNGISISSAEITGPATSFVSNLEVHVYERRIYLNTNIGSIYMLFSCLSEIKDQVTPDFEQAIDSITLIEP